MDTSTGEIRSVEERFWGMEPKAIESLAAELHAVHLRYYMEVYKRDHWAGIDYGLLDERMKEGYRSTARYILRNFIPMLANRNCKEDS